MKYRGRKESFTGLYHVVVKGINKEQIFIQQREKVYFKKIILEFRDKYQIEIFSYCIMSNHAHFLIRAEINNLSSFMARILAKYAMYYNFKHNRNGHVFQNRFNSECVENEEYFWNCIRYIHMNPVKAGIVKMPVRYKYSSMGEYQTGYSIFTCENAMKMYKDHFVDYSEFEKFHSYKQPQIFIDTIYEVEQQKIELAYNIAQKMVVEKNMTILNQVFEEKEYREEYTKLMQQILKISKKEAKEICIKVKNKVEND